MTLWWYIYSAIDLLVGGIYRPNRDFFGFPRWLVVVLAIYLIVSQLIVYILIIEAHHINLDHHGMVKPVRQVQELIILMVCCCVPADGIIILWSPLGDLATVLIFFWVTACFGIPILSTMKHASLRDCECWS